MWWENEFERTFGAKMVEILTARCQYTNRTAHFFPPFFSPLYYRPSSPKLATLRSESLPQAISPQKAIGVERES